MTPELLAPAGDWDCLRAAVENGADAVYFGLAEGFNARARAESFSLAGLPDTMRFLRRRGVKGYVAFNTLVFEDELGRAEDAIRGLAAAGVDALIVQDLGVARLVREVSPDLPVHASTQMTVTTAEAAELARRLGATRVIVGRELSVAEIAALRAKTGAEVEVFVHGALCVAYSGQCLTSEVVGGRSANRGECAQACRLPYDLMVDGRRRDLGPVRYLISPHDLAAWDLLPELVEAGVCSFKIEGRLKSPEYVANVTSTYRRALDETLAGGRPALAAEAVRDLEQSFSRGLSHGWLGGTNHQVLVEGRSPKKRGVLVGTVEARDPRRRTALLALSAPLKPGDGIVFEGDDPEAGEEGGAIYEVFERGRAKGGEALVELGFAREDGPDLARVEPGTRVFRTKDPALDRRLRASFEGAPHRLAPLSIAVRGRAGAPLEVTFEDDAGRRVTERSSMALVPARERALDAALVRDKLGRLGGTMFRLAEPGERRAGEAGAAAGGAAEPVTIDLPEPVALPVSELNRMRRALVAALESAREGPPGYRLLEGRAVERVRAALEARAAPEAGAAPSGGAAPAPAPAAPTAAAAGVELTALVRTHDQVEAALDRGVERIYLDFLELTGLAKAVERIRAASRRALVATPRIAKPGEEPILARLLALEPHGVLVRHLGGLETLVALRERGDPQARALELVGDFSLNIANALTALVLLGRGLDLVTPGFDLDVEQLLRLLERAPAARFEVVIHQHLPTFHMEHCVFAALLSQGADYRTCGRPCEHHAVGLADRTGRVHPVLADVGCRNTVFNDRPQSGAEFLPRLLAPGIRRVRVEMLTEDGRAARGLIATYQDLLDGRLAPREVFRRLNAEGRYGVVGVTRGTLPVVR